MRERKVSQGLLLIIQNVERGICLKHHCEGSRTLGLGFGLGLGRTLGRTFNCIQSPKSRIFETFFLVIFRVFFVTNQQ